jgi:hypothetical protein
MLSSPSMAASATVDETTDNTALAQEARRLPVDEHNLQK